MSEFTKMKITLDFYNKNIVSVSAKQYDNQSRYIEISCTENGKAFLADKNTMSAYIRYRKPDGLGCFNECEITDEGNILVELTEQMLSAQGKAEADIMLLEKVFTSGEKPTDIEDIYEIHAPIISVMSFYVNIAPTALNHAQIESSYEFNALSNALSQIDYNNKKVEALDKELTENENERKTTEAARVNAENSRKSAETDRINNENTRKTNETVRQSNEATRQTQENKRQTDTATAISNANSAAENANNKANDLQNKLDSHHFVLTEDKDVAGGVAGLDFNAKVPISELYDASTTSKGIVQLTNSISSGSLSTAATPNSVKVAYDKTLSVETALNNEITRATAAENTKANIANPTFTGTPKAPTAAAGTNSTQIATTAFVQTAVSSGIAASDAMIIKGTIGTNGTVTALPTTYKTGWTYRVTGAGTYAGQVCEIGDLIIALVDRNGSGNINSDWCVAQTNINGAITGVKSGDAYIQASQTGSVVTITHKDVAATNTTSSVSPAHGGKFTAVKSVARDTKGHVTGVDTETVTLPAAYTLPTASSTVLGGVKTGTNITNSSGTISLTKQNVINALGYTPGTDTEINTTYTLAKSGSTITLTGSDGSKTSVTDSNSIYTAGKNLSLLGTTFSLADRCTIITDWNSVTANGWYMATGANNAPESSTAWFYGVVMAHSTTYVRQILYKFSKDNIVSGSNCDRYERIMHNGTWGTWVNTSVKAAVPANAKFTDTNTTYSTGTSTYSGTTKLYTETGSLTDGTMTQRSITNALNTKASSSHTHNYAGSSTAGGAATSLSSSGIIEVMKKIYPVGCIYMSVSSTNPSTIFGFGTWVAWGNGRVPVGVNTSDSNFNTVEKTGGSSSVKLTVNQMPSHSHTTGVFNSVSGIAENGLTDLWIVGGGETATTYGESIPSRDVGGGQAHTNLQPYITCYMWKRTA